VKGCSYRRVLCARCSPAGGEAEDDLGHRSGAKRRVGVPTLWGSDPIAEAGSGLPHARLQTRLECASTASGAGIGQARNTIRWGPPSFPQSFTALLRRATSVQAKVSGIRGRRGGANRSEAQGED
jgi:hypothetical protein